MPSRIEDYAIIADCRSLALVAKDGSIDWLCLPRFDSDASFAALLGTPDNGRWLLAPAGGVKRVRRCYREGTLILETEIETEEGTATVLDLVPVYGQGTDVLRIVVGNRGRVPMRMELVIRFGYGSVGPCVQSIDGGIAAIAGPDCLGLHTPVKTHGEGLKTVADFTVGEGEQVPFVLTWWPSNLPAPPPVEPEPALKETETGWRKWCQRCTQTGPYREMVQRSLMTLKALTYEPTGGIAAAATTSLPEKVGGERNWDYRYCWLRDATFTLYALMSAGYSDEARAWSDWLLRAVAGSPPQMQIMYGLAGERRLPELELDASLLVLPLVGFLRADDPRMVGTVRAIERELLRDGFVARYRTRSGVDGLPPGEGVFLACSFWLADNYALQGRIEEARSLFERLCGLANDVGLLSEEYDPAGRRFLGNFPQAFSHVSLINTALRLSRAARPLDGTISRSPTGEARP